MQDLVEATHIAITKAVWIAMFQCSIINWKKIESHFETWSSDAQRINPTFVAHSFVANFVRYISAKYYLNWFSFHTVIMKVLCLTFFETQCSWPILVVDHILGNQLSFKVVYKRKY